MGRQTMWSQPYFCELGPAIRNQVLGIIRGHLDDAIWLDVQVPLGKGLHRPAPVPGGGPEANPQAFKADARGKTADAGDDIAREYCSLS